LFEGQIMGDAQTDGFRGIEWTAPAERDDSVAQFFAVLSEACGNILFRGVRADRVENRQGYACPRRDLLDAFGDAAFDHTAIGD